MNSNKTSPSRASDAVLREVWRAKDSLSATYNHDLGRLFAEARKRQGDSGHAVVNLQRDGIERASH